MLIKAKTKKPVLYADEKESSEESPEDLEALIEEARGEHEKETEETSINENDIEVGCFPCRTISSSTEPTL